MREHAASEATWSLDSREPTRKPDWLFTLLMAVCPIDSKHQARALLWLFGTRSYYEKTLRELMNGNSEAISVSAIH